MNTNMSLKPFLFYCFKDKKQLVDLCLLRVKLAMRKKNPRLRIFSPPFEAKLLYKHHMKKEIDLSAVLPEHKVNMFIDNFSICFGRNSDKVFKTLSSINATNWPFFVQNDIHVL